MSSLTTSELLTKQYPPLITQAQLAEIFGQHVQTIRRLTRQGRLPFVDVSITSFEKRYRLVDVIEYIDNPPSHTPTTKSQKKRGRPVGSKNKNIEQLQA